MSNEKFCLKWNDFESNISIAFRDLRDHSEFFDITLACEDNQIQAHKVILSACSPFFRTVLARNSTHPNPLIYLRGIKFTDLESVLNFMYHGEVNVAQDQLNSFLTVAEDLRVKGLTQNKNGESSAEKRSRSPPSSTAKSHQGMSSTDRELQPPPLKRPRPPTSTTNAGRTVNNPAGGESISTGNSALQTENDDDDIQEVVPVKSEPKELVPLASTAQPTLPPSSPTVGGVNECQPANSSQSYHSQAIVHQDEYEENYEDYGQYDDQYIDHQEHLPDSDKGVLGQMIVGNADDLNDLARTYSQPAGQGQVRCTLCGKVSSHSGNARQHFEAHHFTCSQQAVCPVCIKPFRTKHSLSSHMSKNHRGMRA